jgi:hypothetical protein
LEITYGKWHIAKMIDGVEHYKINDEEYTKDKREARIYWTRGIAFMDCLSWVEEYIIDFNI